jgi:hypothetical protein
MHLDNETMLILKNLANINANILFPNGNELKSINDDETIFASIKCSNDFPKECGIYDLNEFLSIVQLVGGQNISKVDFDFQDNFVLITNGTIKSRYLYAPSRLLKYPQKNIKMPEPFVTFDISGSDINKLKQAAGIFHHPNLSFFNKGSSIFAKVFDLKTENDTSDFELLINDVEFTKPITFDYIFNIQNLKYLIATNLFRVSFAAKGKGKIAKFEADSPSINYYIGANESSYFNFEDSGA